MSGSDGRGGWVGGWERMPPPTSDRPPPTPSPVPPRPSPPLPRSGWVHTELQLNRLGRTAPNPPATDPSTGEELPPPPDAPEPSTPLRPLTGDAWPPPGAACEPGGGGSGGVGADYALGGGEDAPTGAWDIRVVPTTGAPGGAPGSSAGGDEGAAPAAAVVVLRSLAYPGAVAVARGKRFACGYVGHGLPAAPAGAPGGGGAFQPSLPPALPPEWDYAGAGLVEQREVTEDPRHGDAAEGGEEGEDA